MPDILKPWIAVYLIHIAETHGADLAGVPVSSKSQKAQIIRFLTDVSKPGALWGMLSDGALSLPVKLAKEAVDDDREIYDEPLSNNCILAVKKYRVIFCRAPLGTGAGMTSDARLVIECTAFDRSSRVPQAILGEPKPITGHVDLHAWSEALKQDGGAGNILKQRKRQAPNSGAKDPPPVIEKKPTLIARSRARIPTELLLSFADKLGELRPGFSGQNVDQKTVYNDREQKDLPKSGRATPCREDTSKRSVESSPEVFIEEWSPTPARIRSPSPAPLTRLRPSQLLLSDCEDEKPEESQMAPSVPTQGQGEPTLDEDKMEIDLERPISYEQPYPPESRKVPKPPSPKSFPKNGAGIVLVPNSDVSMAGSSQPSQGVASQEMMPLRRALSQRDLNVVPGEKLRGSKRTNAQLSQEDHYYDGDEESGGVRAGKKNRLDSCRSVNKEEAPAKQRPESRHDAEAWRKPSFLNRKREQFFGEYPWPIVSARQILDIIAESDARRRV
ncbi:hypothetical protein MD484_g1890, partial [Candolleomyces efflorescens]